MSLGLQGLFWVMLACLLWAIDTLIRYPLLGMGISATKIVFYEHLILTSCFLPVFFKALPKFRKSPASHLFYFFMIGGVGSALATLSFTWAFTLINPSQVILLQKFQPIIAILLAHPILGEKIQLKFMFWASICLLGGIMIGADDVKAAWSITQSMAQNENFLQKNVLLGHALTALAVVGWGSAVVFGRKLTLCGHSEKEIMCGRFLIGLLCLIPFFSTSGPSYLLEGRVLGKVVMMVILSGLLAMYFYYKGLAILPARVGALAEMFFPLFAVIINWVVLGMSLGPMQIMGGILLWVGSTVIELKHY